APVKSPHCNSIFLPPETGIYSQPLAPICAVAASIFAASPKRRFYKKNFALSASTNYERIAKIDYGYQ
ncbi:hypothetical protein ABK848_22425, partial [Enterobacter hormaechei]|uniref:hypothetical protein n=1 Tax=Enterobacter hormaechei TaxID=158836 RepID=UPI003753606F